MIKRTRSSKASSEICPARQLGSIRRRRIGALSTCTWLIAVASACGDGELSDPNRGSDPLPSFGGPAAQNGTPAPISPVGAGGGGSNVNLGAAGAGGSTPAAQDGIIPMTAQLVGSGNGGSSSASAPNSSGASGAGNTPSEDGEDSDESGDEDSDDDTDTTPPPVVTTPPPVVTPPPPVVTPPPPVVNQGPVDCNVLPAPSPLEGWASVSGRGVATTTGGGNARPIVVTTLAQLQNAVTGTAPAVIHVRGTLAPGDVNVGSNKTIVGTCGAEIHGHLEVREAVNVIVRNITIVGYGVGNCALDPGFDSSVGCSSGDDAAIIQRNSHHVWFDHCAVRDGTDGNLDISNAADFITISWTKFFYTPRTDNVGDDSTGAAGHRYSNLVGGTDSPTTFDDANALNVTWHHNWWADNVVERQPRIRFGQNHLYNNYYSSAVSNYCVRAGIQASVLLEGNSFDGSRDPHEFNNTDDQGNANIRLGATNLYTGTTGNQQTGGGGPAFLDPPYDYRLDAAAAVEAAVTSGAGPR